MSNNKKQVTVSVNDKDRTETFTKPNRSESKREKKSLYAKRTHFGQDRIPVIVMIVSRLHQLSEVIN